MLSAFKTISICVVAILSLAIAAAADDANKRTLFETKIVSIFEKHCLSCHNDKDAKGGLSLQNSKSAFKGGDSGAAIVAGQPDKSLLLENVSGDEPEMPQDAQPLSAAEVAVIRTWIQNDAVWPEDIKLVDRSLASLEWWSLKPLNRPAVPAINEQRNANDPQTPIDAFIEAKLAEEHLAPSPLADRRTLIRRAYFDLLGLPPKPDEVDAFIADSSPAAFERLVDRLLDDPRYGERWARHWLDVVHYGDTHGYDKDKLRPNAWPYRDYVIRSLNADKPYAQFVQEQLAGDVLYPHTTDGIVALGFISAGPWDFIGHAEVPESKIDGRVARHLDRDDMVSTTMNAFCSMTVQCAQCHNHKFDPATQEDYYSLQAVFAALDRADKPYDADPETAKQRVLLASQKTSLENQLAALNAEVLKLAGPALADLEKQIADLESQSQHQPKQEFGYHSNIEARQEVAKWVQVDLGSPQKLAHLVIVGCNDDFNGIGKGFGFPARFKIEGSNDAEFKKEVVLIADQTEADYANPGVQPQSFKTDPQPLQYVRVTATKLAPRANDYIFALAELIALDADGKNLAFGKPVTSLDSIEAPVRWQRKNLVDGYYFDVGKTDSLPKLAKLQEERRQMIERVTSDELKTKLAETRKQLADTLQNISQLPPQQMVYAGTVHNGSGAFMGTGSTGGKPREVHILLRGNIQSPDKVVGPGTVPIIPGLNSRFDLPPDHIESDRRKALAAWITHPDNPLTWRSIVNRVWQYHFGRGLVDSPNDFGRMGELPTHPELLDWLAVEFRDGGGSIKHLHRLIMNSRVYQQASADRPEMAEIDSGNQFLWKMNRRRLEAEAIWDTVLTVSGKLRTDMGGPGYWSFVLEKPEHSPHYEYEKLDADDPKTHRRAIYRFIVRSAPDPFMECLDCADPSLLVDKRNQTVTANQALSMLNNKFTIGMAEHFAERAAAENKNAPEQVRFIFREALSRNPTEQELQKIVAYTQSHGLANTCRLVFNLNEFVFVD